MADPEDPILEMPKVKPFKWGFFSAAGVILVAIVIGQFIGTMAEGFGEGGLGLKEVLFLGFAVSAAAYVFLQREAVLRFFRTMHTGVALVSLSTIAVATGVLVPQIDGFEDPDERVTAANYEDQYQAFRWAEGYFLYHLMHLYGIGMPEPDLPPGSTEKLERFGDVYGREEAGNREKTMRAQFTGMKKTAEIRQFIEANDGWLRRAFDLCTFLQLNRTYKSHWFATLLLLLGAGIASNTFRGPPRTWVTLQRSGFFVTHIGMMTILAGGALSKWKTDRGILHLDLRDVPKNEYWRHYDREKIGVMPFHVGLDRFARDDWRQLEVYFPEEGFSSRPPQYTLWEGRTIDLDYAEDSDGTMQPRLRLVVERLHDRASIGQPRFWEAEDPNDPLGLGPLVDLAVPDHEAMAARDPRSPAHGGERYEARLVRLPSLDPDYLDPTWRYRLRTVYGRVSEAELAAEFPPAGASFLALGVRSSAQAPFDARWIPVAAGESLEVEGGFRVEVQEVTADFRLDPDLRVPIHDPRPLAEQFPRNPALKVLIVDAAGGTETRWLFQNLDPVEHGLQANYRFKDLVLELRWDPWRAPGPPRHVLAWSGTEEALVLAEGGAPQTVRVGDRLPLPGENYAVLTELFKNARYDKTIEFVPATPSSDGFDHDFYATDPAGLELTVVRHPGTERETREPVRMAATERGLAYVWDDPGHRFRLHFLENDRIFPYEWRSVLSIYRKNANGRFEKVTKGPEKDREIRVNDYFYHRGYRFFQTNAVPELPTYSGVGVVYDPGIPVVLAGMYTVIAGVVIAFIVRPIGNRRRKQRGKGAQTA